MSGVFSSTARAIRSVATRLTIGAIADGQVLKRVGTTIVGAAAGGDASGPASSTDNAAARFDGTGGKTLQNSAVIIDDTGNVTGLGTINTHTLPAGTDTLVGRASTDTLTNKTLTAPVITSPTGIVKGDVGLGNVDNTSDAAKPVSTAQQTALDLKAPLASPTFTGTVTIPTPFTLGAVSVTPTGTELNFVDGVTSPIQTQLDGKQPTITFGTGVQAALGVNIGSAGAPVVNGGALGTPSSGTLTNATGLPVSGLVDISVRVYLTADQSINNITLTTVNWNGESWDTAGAHDNVTNNSRLTFPATGKYVVYGVIRFAADADGPRQADVYKNGAFAQAAIRLSNAGATDDFVASFSFEMSVNATDYIELKVFHGAGAAINLVANTEQSHFGFRRVA